MLRTLAVSPRPHGDRPRPTELASLRPKTAPMGVPRRVVIVRKPQSIHPPLTSVGAIERATTDRTYGQAHREHPSPWGGPMTSRKQPNPPAGLRSEVAALPQRVPTGLGRDLRKGTGSGNPSMVRSEPAMAAASASTSRCSKSRIGRAVAGGVERARPAAAGADADHQAAQRGSPRGPHQRPPGS